MKCAQALKAGVHQESLAGLDLTLRAYELEARNMEDRILLLSGREHVPLDGLLVSRPAPVIEIGVKGGDHGAS
jgi:hypothetical protein